MTPNDEWGLTGKVAIVTGGGSVGDGIGNGRAACILLARAGAKVLVVDRDLTLAERTVAMIEAEGGTAAAVSYDVTESAQCAAMVADAVSRWGRLDCLDNNVGIGSKGSVVDETDADGEPEGERDHAAVEDEFADADAVTVSELEREGDRDVDAHAV